MTVAELTEKRRRVHALLDRLDLDTLVLRSPGNIAWYAGGARTHILATPDVGVADLVITRDGERVVTAVNEAARLEAEELAVLAPEITVVGWDADRTAVLPRGARVGCDVPLDGTTQIAADVEAARRSLTPAEQDRYRALGRDTAEAFTDIAAGLGPRHSEHHAAGALAAALLARGADPIVLLVAGGDRLAVHRHPLPTAGQLGDLVMVVACARRDGLIANVTRFFAFAPLAGGHRSAYRRLLDVEAAFLTATRPGDRVGSVFAAGAAAYAQHGFPADEVTRHHQGGPTGYASRDYVATAASDAAVEPGQAFAWNPSVPSLKVEDTVLALDSGVEVLSVDPRWPSIVVDGVRRPDVLEVG